jgi:hypothetical protein
MTKKHFIRLADYIKRANNFATAAEPAFTPSQIRDLALFCKECNPAFNQNRWYEYIAGTCGPNGGSVK